MHTASRVYRHYDAKNTFDMTTVNDWAQNCLILTV